MTPEQCRAARGLKDWSQERLAGEAKVGQSTVRNFEAGRSQPVAQNLKAIRTALEAAGVIFVEENGEGPGVRLRKVNRADDHAERRGAATDAVELMDEAITKKKK